MLRHQNYKQLLFLLNLSNFDKTKRAIIAKFDKNLLKFVENLL